MTTEEMLARLVVFPTVVGRPNLDLIGFVEDWLRRHGVDPIQIPGPAGDRANLFATIGPADVPGMILSGHVDVVPADEPGWSGDPFTLRREGDQLVGRGATDMKGFVACILAAVPDLGVRPLSAPIHLALSYDVEAGCVGVRHMIARLPELCAPASGCIVGEPTGLRPLLAHKGKAAVRVTVHGVPGHRRAPTSARTLSTLWSRFSRPPVTWRCSSSRARRMPGSRLPEARRRSAPSPAAARSTLFPRRPRRGSSSGRSPDSTRWRRSSRSSRPWPRTRPSPTR